MSEASNGAAPREPSPALGADLLIPLFGSGLTLYYLTSTWELGWEAKATGTVVGTVLLALCALHLLRVLVTLRARRGTLGLGGLFRLTPFNRQRLALILLALAFVLTVRWIGTTLGLFLLILANLWVMGVRNPRQLIAIPLVTAATVYVLLIWLLNTRLPRGIPEKVLGAMLGGGS